MFTPLTRLLPFFFILFTLLSCQGQISINVPSTQLNLVMPTIPSSFNLGSVIEMEFLVQNSIDAAGIVYNCSYDRVIDQRVNNAAPCTSISGVQFDTNTGKFEWVPQAGQTGAYEFLVKANTSTKVGSKLFAFNIVSNPPTLDAIADQLVAEGDAIMAVDANDGGDDFDNDSEALTYSCYYDRNINGEVLNLTPCSSIFGLSFASTTGTMNWTTQNTQVGDYEFKIVATDGGSLSYALFNIIVTPTNYPPVLDAITNLTISEGSPLYINTNDDGDDFDDDGDTLSYSCDVDGSDCSSLSAVSFNAVSGELSWTPSYTQAGVYNFTITGSDGTLTDDETFTVTVTNTNRPPMLDAINNQTVAEGAAITAINAADGGDDLDADGQAITYSCSVNAANCSTLSGLVFASATGEVSWTPNFSQAGTYNFTITGSDGSVTDSETFTITVTNTNRAPVLDAIVDQTVAEGAAITAINAADGGDDLDIDGQVISYSCDVNGSNCSTLSGASFNAVTGALTWTPNYTQAGTYNFTITGSDGSLSDSEAFVVTVNNSNQPPALDAIANQTTAEGSAITAINAADGGDDLDVDGQTITYSCDVDGLNCSTLTGAAFDTVTGELTWTPDFDQAGTYNFTLTGTDGALSDSEPFTITVTNVNRPPVLAVIDNQTAEESYDITTINANDDGDDFDIDGDAITYSCFYDTIIDESVANSNDCDSLSGFVLNTTSGEIDWTPALGQAGNYEFKIIAKDPSNAQDEKIFSITVATYRTPLISTWRTSADGESITLPLRQDDGNAYNFNYNFIVDWGDGSANSAITSFDDPDITHTYAIAGDYTITIRGTVESWYFNNSGSKDYIISVTNLGDVGWKNLYSSFRGCSNLTSFAGGNTANVTNMSQMFFGANITGIDLTSFNTANVTDMSRMFYSTIGNATLNFSSFNTAKVESMRQMFSFAQDLESLDLSHFDTTNVTTMRSMFASANNLTTLNLSGFNTEKVTDMSWMFSQTNLTTLNLSSFSTANVTDMTFMFFQTPNLATIDLSNFNTSALDSFYGMFKESGVTALDLSHFNTSLITDFRDMFMTTSNLTHLNLNTWDITNSLFSSDIFTGFTGELFCDQPSGEMFGNPCNKFPVLAAIGDQTVAEQIAIAQIDANGAVSGADTDADGETISYNCYVDTTVDGTVANTFDCTTTGATFSTMTGIMDWNTVYGDMGSYEFRIEATDPHGQKSSELFVITVIKGNYAPVLDAITDQTVAENTAITVINAADGGDDLDVDNQPITYSCDVDGSDCSTLTGVNFNTVTGAMSWTPNYTQAGTYNFTITGSDGALTDDEAFTITVTNVNRPPSLAAINNQTGEETYAITTINANDGGDDFDIDLEAITYSCFYDTTIDTAVAESTACTDLTGVSFDAATGVMDWTPVVGQAGSYEFKIIAKDPSNAQDSKIFSITVATYRAPFISTWRTTAPGESVTLPLPSGYNYNFTVDWGDGSAVNTITAFDDSDITHSYAASGDYTVTLKGTLEAWSFNWSASASNIIQVTNLGDMGWKNLDNAFAGCANLTSFAGGNTSQVTSMNYMFDSASSLTSLDVSTFDTSLVTDMSYAFSNLTALNTLNLSNFNTANVTNMAGLFSGSLMSTLDVSNFNTTNVTDMSNLFSSAENLTSLDLSSFNTNNVTTMQSMFYYTTNLASINFGTHFNTPQVTNMNGMFSSSGLSTLDLTTFDTANVTNMNGMFSGMTNLTSLNISNFNTSKLIDMSYMFSNTSSLATLDLSSFNTSNVTDMSYLFNNVSSLTSLDLSNFNTSSVNNMLYMFNGMSSLSTLDISSFNTSNVTMMAGMFKDCGSLTLLDLSHFSTPNVIVTSYMFNGMTNLSQLTLYDWTVDQITAVNYLDVYTGSSPTLLCNHPSGQVFEKNCNKFPVLATINDQTVAEQIAIAQIDVNGAVSGADTDADGESISYNCYVDTTVDGTVANTFDCSTVGATFSVVTGIMDWTPVYGDMGSYEFRIEATDPYGQKSSELFVITVTKGNYAPVLDTINDQTVVEGAAITAINAADGGDDLDVDGQTITYSCEVNGSDCSTLTGVNFNTVSGVMNWTPNYDLAGSYNFTITGTDGALTDDEAFTITVTNTNRSPDLDNISNQTAEETIAITTVDANDSSDDLDADLEPITYSCFYDTAIDAAVAESTACTDLTGVSFNTTTGVMNWTPSLGQAGNYEFKIIGKDPSNAEASKIFNITVAAYVAPFISTWRTEAPSESITLPLRSGYNYNFTVDWGDGSALRTVTAYNDPDITHTYAAAGDYTVTIRGLVEAWYGDGAPSNTNIIAVNQLGQVGWKNLEWAFGGCFNLQSFTVGTTDTSSVTDMSYMFRNVFRINTLDLSSLNTSNVTNMSGMFYGMSGLTSINLSNFDTSKVTSMASMFTDTYGLTALDLTDFDTSNVTDMSSMFNNSNKLTSLNISSFNTSNVTNMSEMFVCTESLTSLDLSNFNTVNVTNMASMFDWMTELTSLDLSSFNTANVTNMYSMFNRVIKLTALDLSHFNTSKVTDVRNMFNNTSALTTLKLYNWDIDPTPLFTGVFTSFPGTLFCDQPGSTMFGKTCNNFPTLNSIDDQTVAEQIAIAQIDANGAVSGADTDADGETISYNCYVDTTVDGTVANTFDCSTVGATFSVVTGIMDWTPVYGDMGSYEFRIEATDPYGQKSSELFEITVTKGNHSPELAAISNQLTSENQAITTINASDTNTGNDTDIDGDVLSYTCTYDGVVDGAVNAGSNCTVVGATFDVATGILNWTPSYTQAGDWEFKIVATDLGGATDAMIFAIGVNNVNRPPVLKDITDQAVETGNAINIINGEDANTNDDLDIDGETLTYSCYYDNSIDGAVSTASVCSGITGLTFNSTAGTINWTPAAGQQSDYEFKMIASDGTDIDSKIFSIIVTKPPVPFITVWRTATANESITLPLRSTGSYNFTVDWGDGSAIDTITAYDAPLATHIYAAAGDYTVTIKGTLTEWGFYNAGSKSKIIAVNQLGEMGWTSLAGGFWGCNNLSSFTAGATDTSNIVSFSNAFREMPLLTSIDLSTMSTANATDMGYMFYSSSLQSLDLSNFNTEKVTTMISMFRYASSLTSLNLSSFNTSNVSQMGSMFESTRGLTALDLSSFNTSKVTSMALMFSDTKNMTSLNLSSFNTANVMAMSSMFNGASKLTTLDLSSFNTSNVTTMSAMFQSTSNLLDLDLSNFNTVNVTSMSSMFTWSSKLVSVDVSNFNTIKVNDMSSMFYNTFSLSSLNLSSFDTRNVVDMSQMFCYSMNLTSLDISNFNTANVTNMQSMFYSTSNLTELNLSHFNTSNVTNMLQMFSITPKLASLDLSSFNTSNVTNMGSFLNGARKLTTLDLSHFNTSNVTNMSLMFKDTILLTELNLNSWDIDPLPTSTDIFTGFTGTLYCDQPGGTMFGKACSAAAAPFSMTVKTTTGGEVFTLPLVNGYIYSATINWGDGTPSSTISTWDDIDKVHTYTNAGTYTITVNGTLEAINFGAETYSAGKVIAVNQLGDVGWKTFDSAFSHCGAMATFNVGTTDTSQVTSMKNMFAFANALTSLNLTGIDTNNVTSLQGMLYSTPALLSVTLSSFNTQNVTTMRDMFNQAGNLTSLDLSAFVTNNVTDMAAMFASAQNITSLNLSSFNTNNVTEMSDMFYGTISLTTLDISNFQTSNVTTMAGMFSYMPSLTSLDLSTLNTQNVTDMTGMFSYNPNLDVFDFSAFNVSSAQSMFGMFSNSSSTGTIDLSHFDTSNVSDMSEMFADSSLSGLNLSNWNISFGASTSTDVFLNFSGTLYCNQGGSPGTGALFEVGCN